VEHRYSQTFERDDREIARARDSVAHTLRSWGATVEVPVLQLLVSELITNALVHGAGRIEVVLLGDARRVRLEVANGGGATTAPRLVDRRDAAGGWGLQMVDQLSDSWGVEQDDQSTRVWTEVRRSDPEPP
jgi:anti-sigma regulatory factor (Ser/Thr protein kinase)